MATQRDRETHTHTNNQMYTSRTHTHTQQILVNPCLGENSWRDNTGGGAVKVREKENVGLGFSEIPLWPGRSYNSRGCPMVK